MKGFLVILALVASFAAVLEATTAGCPDCPDKLDLAFVLDNSGSIWDHGTLTWNNTVDFIAGIVMSLHIGPDNVQVAVMTYNDHPLLHLTLHAEHDKDQLVRAIYDLKKLPTGDNTNTDAALKAIREEVFNPANGARGDHVPKAAILLSDGYVTDYADVKLQAEELRKANIDIISVAIVQNANEDILKEIAVRPDAFLESTSYDSLGLMKTPLLEMLTSVVPTPKPTTTTTTTTTKTTTTTTTTTAAPPPPPPVTLAPPTPSPGKGEPINMDPKAPAAGSDQDDKGGNNMVDTILKDNNINLDGASVNGDSSSTNGNPHTHVGTNNVVVVNGHQPGALGTGGSTDLTTIIIIVVVVGLITIIVVIVVVMVIWCARKKKKTPPTSPTVFALPPGVSWSAASPSTVTGVTATPQNVATPSSSMQGTSAAANPAAGDDHFVLVDEKTAAMKNLEMLDNSVNDNRPPSYTS